jgi:hypothetical protein
MAGTLQNRLGELALAFSESVLDAIRGASLGELFGESSGSTGRRGASAARAQPAPDQPAEDGAVQRRGGRLVRRSSSDIERIVNEILSLLAEHPAGLRAEEIRERLDLVAKELPRPLKEAVDAGLLGKSGQKRATTYFLAGGAGASRGLRAAENETPSLERSRRAAKKASAKKAKKTGATKAKAKKASAKKATAKKAKRGPSASASAKKAPAKKGKGGAVRQARPARRSSTGRKARKAARPKAGKSRAAAAAAAGEALAAGAANA